jgi:hypothetical protein
VAKLRASLQEAELKGREIGGELALKSKAVDQLQAYLEQMQV